MASSKMSQEAKDKLKLAKIEQRKANPLIRDFDLSDWLVARDYAYDNGLLELEVNKSYSDVLYLKYISPEIVEALSKILPHIEVPIQVPSYHGEQPYRVVFCFRREVLFCMLDFLGVNRYKYTNSPLGRVWVG